MTDNTTINCSQEEIYRGCSRHILGCLAPIVSVCQYTVRTSISLKSKMWDCKLELLCSMPPSSRFSKYRRVCMHLYVLLLQVEIGQVTYTRCVVLLWKSLAHTLCPIKTSPFLFFKITRSKIKRFQSFWYTNSWGHLTLIDYKFAHFTWKMSPHYLVKCKKIRFDYINHRRFLSIQVITW